jgi:hypothetical protein
MSKPIEEGRTADTDARLALANGTNRHAEIGDEAKLRILKSLREIHGLPPKEAIQLVESKLYDDEKSK